MSKLDLTRVIGKINKTKDCSNVVYINFHHLFVARKIIDEVKTSFSNSDSLCIEIPQSFFNAFLLNHENALEIKNLIPHTIKKNTKIYFFIYDNVFNHHLIEWLNQEFLKLFKANRFQVYIFANYTNTHTFIDQKVINLEIYPLIFDECNNVISFYEWLIYGPTLINNNFSIWDAFRNLEECLLADMCKLLAFENSRNHKSYIQIFEFLAWSSIEKLNPSWKAFKLFINKYSIFNQSKLSFDLWSKIVDEILKFNYFVRVNNYVDDQSECEAKHYLLFATDNIIITYFQKLLYEDKIQDKNYMSIECIENALFSVLRLFFNNKVVYQRLKNLPIIFHVLTTSNKYLFVNSVNQIKELTNIINKNNENEKGKYFVLYNSDTYQSNIAKSNNQIVFVKLEDFFRYPKQNL